MLRGWSRGRFEGVGAAAGGLSGLVWDSWGAGGRIGEVQEEVRACLFGVVFSGSVLGWGGGTGWRGRYHTRGGLVVVNVLVVGGGLTGES